MASIGVKQDNLRDSPVTRAQSLPSPGHRLSLVSGKPTLLLKGPSLDRIPSRERVSSRSQLFPKRVLLLKGPSLSGQLRKRVHSQHSKPCFGSMDQRSPQPLEGRREVTTVRGQSQSMRFELPTSNSVNEDSWEREMIRAKSLDQEKVGGRLAAHSEAWNRVTRDNFVLGSVQGHLIQFNRKPPLVRPTEKCEVQVPKGQQQEMNRQIQTLLKEGNIEEAPNNKGFFTYPFLIPKKNGKSRFIMNLKPLNRYIKCTKFKMTTLKQIRESLRNGQWAVQMDIKSAYCHVPMHRRHRCFLRFRYKGKVYQFKTLPFGLSTAPKTFTRCTRPILLYCRKLGITLFLYLDDALVLGDTYDQAKTNGRIVAKLLLDLGFVLSLEKCNFEPTQVFTHLGVTWNTKTMMLSLPQEKVQAIQKQARHVLRNPTCRAVQRLLGLTNFASIALPLARLQSRPLQWWLKQHYKGPSDMFKTMPITEEARHNLEWWRSFKSHPKSIHRPSVQEVVTTDASTKGFGGECNRLAFQGEWPGSKGRDTHINLLELETVWKACNKFESEIKGKATSFQIDNRTAVAYLMKEGGTRCRQLDQLARKILLKCHRDGVTPIPAYLRGIANLRADALSRNQKAQEWSLSISACRRLFKLMGQPVVDLFASSRTFKVDKYYSTDLTDRRAIGSDGAREKWPPGLRYAFPPPPMIQLTLGQLKLMGGELILITPYWPDQCWFPEVIRMAVIPPRRFKPHKWLLTNATTGEAIPKVMESIKLTAWKLSTGYVGEKGYLMKPRNESSVDGARVPRQVTDQHGMTGVLSAVKKGYQSFKFV